MLLLGRQNIFHPPGEPNPLWCNELLQARLPVRKQLELGPSPKGKLSAPDTDSPDTPRTPPSLGCPPKLSQLLWPLLSVLPTRKTTPSSNGRFGSNSWVSTVCLYTGHHGGTVKMALPTCFSSQTALGLVRALPQLGCVFWDSLPCSDSEPHVVMQPPPQYREPREQAAHKVSLYQMQSCSFTITVTMLPTSELEYLCARLIGHQDAGTWEWRPGERTLGAHALAPRSWVSRASVLQHVQCVVPRLAAGILQELIRNIESPPQSS